MSNVLPQEIEDWLVEHPAAFVNKQVSRSVISEWSESHVPVRKLNKYVKEFYETSDLNEKYTLGREIWGNIDTWWISTINTKPPAGLFPPYACV